MCRKSSDGCHISEVHDAFIFVCISRNRAFLSSGLEGQQRDWRGKVVRAWRTRFRRLQLLPSWKRDRTIPRQRLSGVIDQTGAIRYFQDNVFRAWSTDVIGQFQDNVFRAWSNGRRHWTIARQRFPGKIQQPHRTIQLRFSGVITKATVIEIRKRWIRSLWCRGLELWPQVTLLSNYFGILRHK